MTQKTLLLAAVLISLRKSSGFRDCSYAGAPKQIVTKCPRRLAYWVIKWMLTQAGGHKLVSSEPSVKSRLTAHSYDSSAGDSVGGSWVFAGQPV